MIPSFQTPPWATPTPPPASTPMFSVPFNTGNFSDAAESAVQYYQMANRNGLIDLILTVLIFMLVAYLVYLLIEALKEDS